MDMCIKLYQFCSINQGNWICIHLPLALSQHTMSQGFTLICGIMVEKTRCTKLIYACLFTVLENVIFQNFKIPFFEIMSISIRNIISTSKGTVFNCNMLLSYIFLYPTYQWSTFCVDQGSWSGTLWCREFWPSRRDEEGKHLAWWVSPRKIPAFSSCVSSRRAAQHKTTVWWEAESVQEKNIINWWTNQAINYNYYCLLWIVQSAIRICTMWPVIKSP